MGFMPSRGSLLKEANMIKNLQKIIFIGSFAVCALYFIYTLVFSTPWATGFDRYGTFYDEIQVVNHVMFEWAFPTLVFSALGLIFHSHNNRHFFFLNYVFLGLSVYYMIRTAQFTLEIVPPFKEVYLALPSLDHRLVLAGNGIRGLYPEDAEVMDIVRDCSVVFDIGAWLSYLMYAFSGLMVLMGLYKVYYWFYRRAFRKKMLSEVRQ
jgi:hypothetical protein